MIMVFGATGNIGHERISGNVEILTGTPPRTLNAYLSDNAAAFQRAQALA